MSGILFSYASIIFHEFYFCDSKEPREAHMIKFLQKLRILQYHIQSAEFGDIT